MVTVDPKEPDRYNHASPYHPMLLVNTTLAFKA
jgi:hypothetical protein